MDVNKLKVVELRAELAKRGLDQKGNKPVLVQRLQEALDAEGEEFDGDASVVSKGDQEEVGDEAMVEAKPSPQDDTSAQSAASSEPEGNPEEDSSQFVSYQEESESKPDESEVNDDSVDNVAEESNEPAAIRDDESRDSAAVAVDESSVQSGLGYDSSSQPAQQSEDPFQEDLQQDEEPQTVFDQNSSSNYKEPESMDTWNQPESNSTDDVQPSFHLEDSNAQDALDTEQQSHGESEAAEPVETPAPVPDEVMDQDQEQKAVVKEEPDADSNANSAAIEKPPSEIKERRRNRWGDAEETKHKPSEQDKQLSEIGNDYKERRKRRDEDSVKSEDGEKHIKSDSSRPSDVKDEERSRSRRPSEERSSRKRERSPRGRQSTPPRRSDDEPEFDDNAVLLSWYDSDLHMVINKEKFCSASLLTADGFGYVWAGVRSTYGFEKGKIYYEVKITENLDASGLEDEPNPHVLRVGWSVNGTSLQLGEEPLSFGYGGTGKISCDCKFQDYGKPFILGDVVGAYLDMDSNPITLSFTLNGEEQGVAYTIDPSEIKGKALFPHVLSKNCAFSVNFGQEDPWFPVISEYINVGSIPLEDRIAGPKRPEKREDCEAIMMIGLPAAGKTTWANSYAIDHKDKYYNILGTNALIDKMKVMGLPRRRNYSGRWEGLIAKCTKCLNTLLEIGSHRRRNYIVDQTNVYPTAQRRKMRGFDGFVRRAVVIVPSDEDLKARTAKREAEEGKDVPDSAVLEMKANFVLPEKDIFSKIDFVELQEEEAKELVKQYNKEGNDAGYESKFQYGKRPRAEERDRSRSRGGFGGRGRGGYGDRRENDRRFGGRFGDRGNFSDRGRFGDRGNVGDRSSFGDRSRSRGGFGGDRGGFRGERSGGSFRDRPFNDRASERGPGGWNGGGPRGGSWRDSRGSDGAPTPDRSSWGAGGRPDRYPKEERSSASGGGRGGRDDRSGDRDKRSMVGPTKSSNQGNWNQAGAAGMQGANMNQAAGWQGYGNQWGNWGQGYNTQQSQNAQQNSQWKGYGQQMGQGWGQQGWGNQGWPNWNQQYYNQAYQQGWGQQAQGTGADASQGTQVANAAAAATAAAYGAYGQTGSAATVGQQAAQWAGYAQGMGAYSSMTGANAAQQGAAASANYNSSSSLTKQ